MTSTLKAFIILAVGLLLFGAGSWIRFNADDLGTVRMADGVKMVANSQMYIESSMPVMWSGAALVVLSLAGWLFIEGSGPIRRRRSRTYGGTEY